MEDIVVVVDKTTTTYVPPTSEWHLWEYRFQWGPHYGRLFREVLRTDEQWLRLLARKADHLISTRIFPDAAPTVPWGEHELRTVFCFWAPWILLEEGAKGPRYRQFDTPPWRRYGNPPWRFQR